MDNKKRLIFVYLLVFLVFDAVLWLVVRAFIDAQLAIKCLYALISAQLIYLSSIYVGSFVNDKREGKRKLLFADGSYYVGDWVNNIMHGKGKYTYADGDCYEGDYADGKMHGKGKYTYANGGCYEGDFVDGKKHGKGKHTFADGDCYEGDYINGVFQADDVGIIGTTNSNDAESSD